MSRDEGGELVPVPHVPGREAKTLPTANEAIAFADFVELDERADLPQFPIDALPVWAADWAVAAAEAEQVPLDTAAVLALAAISTAVMGKAKVALWKEPLGQFFMIFDRSGSNKSGILKTAMGPIEACVARLDREFGNELAVWTATLEVAQARLKSAKGGLAKSSKALGPDDKVTDRAMADAELKAAAKEVHRLEASRPPGGLAFCGDVTPEVFALLLARNHAVTLQSAEGDEIIAGTGRYQKGGESTETLKKAWKGDFLRIDRKNGTHISKADPLAGVVAMSQPIMLRHLRDREGKREGGGLLGRFTFIVPRSVVGSRRMTSGEIDPAVGDAYRRQIERLFGLPYPEQTDGEVMAPMMATSSEAEAVARAFFDEVEWELRDAGDLVDVESFASKTRSTLLRTAGCLHLGNAARFSDTITETTMADALAITRYFLAHGKVAYGLMDADSGAALALRLFAKIAELAERGPEGGLLKLRDVVFAAHGAKAFKTAKAREAAVNTLEVAGYVRRVNPDKADRSERLAVNPEALAVWQRRQRGVNAAKVP